MAFKIFEKYGAAARDKATLRASGYLFLSRSLVKRCGLDAPTACLLYYDDEQMKIGVKLKAAMDENEKGCRKINIEKSGVTINVMPVLRFYGLQKPRKRQLNVDIQDSLIVVDIPRNLEQTEVDDTAPEDNSGAV